MPALLVKAADNWEQKSDGLTLYILLNYNLSFSLYTNICPKAMKCRTLRFEFDFKERLLTITLVEYLQYSSIDNKNSGAVVLLRSYR